MKTRFFFLTALLALTFPFISHAQIPRTLSYQGVLTDNAGNPRPDGNYTFTFRLYTSLTGGTAIWSESKSLPVKSGLFSTVLGEQTPFGATVKFDKQYWLGIQVQDELNELSPRIPLTSVGYSFSSLRADTANVSVASLADTTWRHSGANIYRMNGNIGIGTTAPTAKLEVVGRTKTQVLEITGGADLAEPFEISQSQPIPKGALVIIDEDNPGQLKLSHQAYDKGVAGVISGAGGINPGLTLTQEGVMEGGQNVALSGRVYALATAANGPIKPGDLLTTSDVAGHAMKATDVTRSHGAVIGKAMSVLENGEGLVLVLVNLQ
ncbi:hypothetical protein L0337_20175 [candidate division KSB1 bacterium]|nr:hypothetical protein [candidate division KSB1 bacterium]